MCCVVFLSACYIHFDIKKRTPSSFIDSAWSPLFLLACGRSKQIVTWERKTGVLATLICYGYVFYRRWKVVQPPKSPSQKYDLLEPLAKSSLPFELSNPADIDKVPLTFSRDSSKSYFWERMYRYALSDRTNI